MATHSSILAWKILWTEVPGRLQSIGSQRVGHDWAFMHLPAQQLFYVSTSLHVPIVNSWVSLLLQKTRTQGLVHGFSTDLGDQVQNSCYLKFKRDSALKIEAPPAWLPPSWERSYKQGIIRGCSSLQWLQKFPGWWEEASMAEWFRSPTKGKVYGGGCFGSPVVCLSCVLWFLWMFSVLRPLGYLHSSRKRGMGKPHQPTSLPSAKVFPRRALEIWGIGIPVWTGKTRGSGGVFVQNKRLTGAPRHSRVLTACISWAATNSPTPTLSAFFTKGQRRQVIFQRKCKNALWES